MKKILSVLIFGALPTFAFAAGGHSDGHQMQGHDLSKMNVSNSATGKPGKASNATRTIELVMNDSMRFTPNTINVKSGETVRFFIKNAGKIPHEMVIGSASEMKEHAAMMRKMPGMKHAEPNMISLNPGQKGALVWEFTQAGTVDFACLISGHMEAGMLGKIKVG